ncbi:hypothetical protein G7Z17_g4670 [Cylindrodendrum hubeiense]|uniref:SRPBCC domain-containing protein n=1 Tax=Cylindrodendrum hubeiense TaxID=595255 RepID=A0A9P5LCF7_9HYPO|nr:hypothetical protein G7Z17_g4670 [Cylindrodendrum hubeiense]
MASTHSVSAQIEILAPPATVRLVFLDFARYDQWHKGWTVEPIEAEKPSELQIGDRLKVNMHGMVFRPVVAENSPECFIWEGSLSVIITGKHWFYFSPSKENPGGTTFIQSEKFTGLLTALLWPWRNKKYEPSENWKTFNAALKKEAEKSSQIYH